MLWWKNDKKVKTTDMISPSETFVVITQLLRVSVYIIHKKDVSQSTDLTYLNAFPMDISSLIRYQFDVEIPSKFYSKFAKISSILKEEFTWKLWHRFDVEISKWIRLSKSMKHRWVLHVDFSMSFRRRIDVTSVLAVFILSFSNIFCPGNLF